MCTSAADTRKSGLFVQYATLYIRRAYTDTNPDTDPERRGRCTTLRELRTTKLDGCVASRSTPRGLCKYE